MKSARPLFGFLALSALGVVPVFASTNYAKTPAPYAKSLVERTVRAQADLLDMIVHVTPPGTKQNVAVAAHTAKEQGAVSGDDDVQVMVTGKPAIEVQKDGVRIGVLLPLQDKQHHTIGTLGLMYRFHAGDNEGLFFKRAEKTKDELASQIPSLESLFR